MTDGSVEAILAAVRASYRGFQAYEDAGVVFESGAPRVSFETRFTRPSLFDFSYSAAGRDGALQPQARLTRQDGALSFWTVLKVPAPESLRLCIAALTGISCGAAHGASSLLLEEVGGWLPTELTSPVLLADEELHGVSCYHVRGGHPTSAGAWSLFIDKASLLIRRRVAHDRPADITEYRTCHAR